jgi:hypothetical protein
VVWPRCKAIRDRLVIKQSLSFWDTPSQSHNRIAQQATRLLFVVCLLINLVNPPSRPKSASIRCQPLISSLKTFMMLHHLEMISIPLTTQEDYEAPSTEDITDMRLINDAKSIRTDHLPPGDICHVMSKSSTRMVNSTHIAYFVSKH